MLQPTTARARQRDPSIDYRRRGICLAVATCRAALVQLGEVEQRLAAARKQLDAAALEHGQGYDTIAAMVSTLRLASTRRREAEDLVNVTIDAGAAEERADG